MRINIGIIFDGTININEDLRGKTKITLEGINLLRERNRNINLNCVV